MVLRFLTFFLPFKHLSDHQLIELANLIQIKKIPANKLTEGDWIVKSVKIKNKIIKPSVHGLSKEEISFLKKAKKQVIVKYGLPFIPIFLLSVICSLFFGNLLMLFFLIFV